MASIFTGKTRHTMHLISVNIGQERDLKNGKQVERMVGLQNLNLLREALDV